MGCYKRIFTWPRGKIGRTATNNRGFVKGMFWIVKTGVLWWDLPPDYGK